MTITAQGLDAYDGHELVVVVRDQSDQPADRAAVCTVIQGPDFSVSAVASTIIPPGYCQLGAAAFLPAAEYFVVAAIFKTGVENPVACMEALALVEEDVELQLPPPGACN